MMTQTPPKRETPLPEELKKKKRHAEARRQILLQKQAQSKSNQVVLFSVLGGLVFVFLLVVLLISIFREEEPKVPLAPKKSEGAVPRVDSERSQWIQEASRLHELGQLEAALDLYRKANGRQSSALLRERIGGIERQLEDRALFVQLQKRCKEVSASRGISLCTQFLEEYPRSDFREAVLDLKEDLRFLADAEKKKEEEKENPLPPVEPDPGPAPKRQPPKPVSKHLSSLQALQDFASGSTRSRAAREIEPFLYNSGSRTDLVQAMYLILSRTEREWRLVEDTLEVTTDKVQLQYKGILLKKSPLFMEFQTRVGSIFTMRKVDGEWTFRFPNGQVISEARCVAKKEAPSPARKELQTIFKEYPPVDWFLSDKVDHLSIARRCTQAFHSLVPGGKGLSSKDPSAVVLRLLAGGHASVVLSEGKESEKSAIVRMMKKVGFVQVGKGRYSTELDRTLLRAMQKVQEGDRNGALSALRNSSSKSEFPALYLSAVLHMPDTITQYSLVGQLEDLFEKAGKKASTPAHIAHIQALLESVDLLKRCVSCRGTGRLRCTPCGGDGIVTTACPKTRVIAGRRGGEVRCTKCRGRGKIDRPCNPCNRSGWVACKKGIDPYQLPRPADFWSTGSCSLCKGKGYFGDLFSLCCPGCHGLRVLVQPTSDPTATLLAK